MLIFSSEILLHLVSFCVTGHFHSESIINSVRSTNVSDGLPQAGSMLNVGECS